MTGGTGCSRTGRPPDRWLLLLAVCLAATGCASYTQRVTKVRSAFYANQLASAEQLVADDLRRAGGEADVLRLEQSLILLAAGRAREAEQTLRVVRDNFERLEQQDIAESTWSYLTDDQRRAYAGEDYEKVLLRALLAMSNLMHDGGDAEAYSLQLIDKQEQIIAAGADEQGDNPKLAYQRVALAPYLRGVLREATHVDYDDAQRSFAAVVSWQPNFVPGRYDVERATHGHHSEPGHGVLYVFAFTGKGPYKEEVIEQPSSAALLIAGQIVSVLGQQTVPPNVAPVKIPRVVTQPNHVQAVGVAVNAQPCGATATITDVSLLARQQCDALLSRTVARAVARRVIKKGLVYGTKEAAGFAKHDVASLAVDLAGVAWEATESADTRCWGLLPDKIQVLRVELPAGDHELRLTPLDARQTPAGAAVGRRVHIDDGANTYALAVFPTGQLVGQILVSHSGAPR
ncbi:MAG: hypothetical protein U0935_06145 [Pirellulales bacterium]